MDRCSQPGGGARTYWNKSNEGMSWMQESCRFNGKELGSSHLMLSMVSLKEEA